MVNRLKDMREDNEYKQEQIAEILNISRQYYSRYELGQVDLPIRHYIKLAQLYNVSIDYLTGIIDKPRPLDNDTASKKVLTQKELALIKAYNENKEHQKTIDKILDLGD